MDIRLFTLCDGAYNYNGKLTIVGTTDNIKVPHFPATVSFGIAVKVSFPPQEYGTKNISLRIIDDSGVDVLPELLLPPSDAKSKNGEEARLVLAGNMQSVNFVKEGEYCVLLNVSGQEVKLPFRVIK